MEITLQSVLTSIGEIFIFLIDFVDDICKEIATNPLLLIGFCVPIAFLIIKFEKSFFDNIN